MGLIDEPRKWCQDTFKMQHLDENRVVHVAYCAEGAIREAIPMSARVLVDQESRVYRRVVSALKELYPAGHREESLALYSGIAPWNDHPGMDQPTMYAAFTKARNKALEEGQ